MRFPSEWYEEFLRNAAFGLVRVGASESSVLRTAGTPEDEGFLSRSMRILAFRSKHLQITSKSDRVVHVGLYFRDEQRTPVVLPNLELSSRTSADDLRNWMRGEGVAWDEEMYAGTLHIRLPSGVVAVLDEGVLDSLQVS